tara:strand:- start:56102 stop:62578 length:6477 start_codon:yes stop_codon:yes gene_type:complete
MTGGIDFSNCSKANPGTFDEPDDDVVDDGGPLVVTSQEKNPGGPVIDDGGGDDDDDDDGGGDPGDPCDDDDDCGGGGVCDGGTCTGDPVVGCMDDEATNYNPLATEPCANCCEYDDEPCYCCMDGDAINFDPVCAANPECVDCGILCCEYDDTDDPVYGCMDDTASNYNPNATSDDGSCKYTHYGCTDPTANNYGGPWPPGDIVIDDGSCEYDEPDNKYPTILDPNAPNVILLQEQITIVCDGPPVIGGDQIGCMDDNADNYDHTATIPCEDCCEYIECEGPGDCGTTVNGYPQICVDNTCVDPGCSSNDDCGDGWECDGGTCVDEPDPPAEGCTNPDACNYDSTALLDDGSCILCPEGECVDGDCVEPDCSESNPCIGACSVCVEGTCHQIGDCANNTECGNDQSCVDCNCEDNPECTDDSHCTDPTGAGNPYHCNTDGVCEETPQNDCESSIECPPCSVCVGEEGYKECVAGPQDPCECDEAHPCPEGEQCTSSECTPICCGDPGATPCPEGYHCENLGGGNCNACVLDPPPPECDESNPCDADYECVNGDCVYVDPGPDCEEGGNSCVLGENACCPGLVCDAIDQGGVGVCRPPGSTGDSCNGDNGCSPGLICYNGACEPEVCGCTDPLADNHDDTANSLCGGTLESVCTYPECYNHGDCGDSLVCIDGDCVEGCLEDGDCGYTEVCNYDTNNCVPGNGGCTNPAACNYNQHADYDNGTCNMCDQPDTECINNNCYGCTNDVAENYSSQATHDNGNCFFGDCDFGAGDCPNGYVCVQEVCQEDGGHTYGCTDHNACNYCPTCNYNDGNCDYTTCRGCMESGACNYDHTATLPCNDCCDYESCGGGTGGEDPTFNCIGGVCVISSDGTGTYPTLGGCQEACGGTPRYDCDGELGCIETTAGVFTSLAACEDSGCEGGGTWGFTTGDPETQVLEKRFSTFHLSPLDTNHYGTTYFSVVKPGTVYNPSWQPHWADQTAGHGYTTGIRGGLTNDPSEADAIDITILGGISPGDLPHPEFHNFNASLLGRPLNSPHPFDPGNTTKLRLQIPVDDVDRQFYADNNGIGGKLSMEFDVIYAADVEGNGDKVEVFRHNVLWTVPWSIRVDTDIAAPIINYSEERIVLIHNTESAGEGVNTSPVVIDPTTVDFGTYHGEIETCGDCNGAHDSEGYISTATVEIYPPNSAYTSDMVHVETECVGDPTTYYSYPTIFGRMTLQQPTAFMSDLPISIRVTWNFHVSPSQTKIFYLDWYDAVVPHPVISYEGAVAVVQTNTGGGTTTLVHPTIWDVHPLLTAGGPWEAGDNAGLGGPCNATQCNPRFRVSYLKVKEDNNSSTGMRSLDTQELYPINQDYACYQAGDGNGSPCEVAECLAIDYETGIITITNPPWDGPFEDSWPWRLPQLIYLYINYTLSPADANNTLIFGDLDQYPMYDGWGPQIIIEDVGGSIGFTHDGGGDGKGGNSGRGSYGAGSRTQKSTRGDVTFDLPANYNSPRTIRQGGSRFRPLRTALRRFASKAASLITKTVPLSRDAQVLKVPTTAYSDGIRSSNWSFFEAVTPAKSLISSNPKPSSSIFADGIDVTVEMIKNINIDPNKYQDYAYNALTVSKIEESLSSRAKGLLAGKYNINGEPMSTTFAKAIRNSLIFDEDELFSIENLEEYIKGNTFSPVEIVKSYVGADNIKKAVRLLQKRSKSLDPENYNIKNKNQLLNWKILAEDINKRVVYKVSDGTETNIYIPNAETLRVYTSDRTLHTLDMQDGDFFHANTLASNNRLTVFSDRDKAKILNIKDTARAFNLCSREYSMDLACSSPPSSVVELVVDTTGTRKDYYFLKLDKTSLEDQVSDDLLFNKTTATYDYITDTEEMDAFVKNKAFPHFSVIIRHDDMFFNHLEIANKVTATFQDMTLENYTNTFDDIYVRRIPWFFIVIPSDKTTKVVTNQRSQYADFTTRTLTITPAPSKESGSTWNPDYLTETVTETGGINFSTDVLNNVIYQENREYSLDFTKIESFDKYVSGSEPIPRKLLPANKVLLEVCSIKTNFELGERGSMSFYDLYTRLAPKYFRSLSNDVLNLNNFKSALAINRVTIDNEINKKYFSKVKEISDIKSPTPELLSDKEEEGEETTVFNKGNTTAGKEAKGKADAPATRGGTGGSGGSGGGGGGGYR